MHSESYASRATHSFICSHTIFQLNLKLKVYTHAEIVWTKTKSQFKQHESNLAQILQQRHYKYRIKNLVLQHEGKRLCRIVSQYPRNYYGKLQGQQNHCLQFHTKSNNLLCAQTTFVCIFFSFYLVTVTAIRSMTNDFRLYVVCRRTISFKILNVPIR